MMKTKLFLLLLLGSYMGANAQNHRTCFSTEVVQQLRQADPDYDRGMKESEDILRKWVNTNQQDPYFAARAIRTIPVVVHVIYNTSAQNVSNSAIQSMIAQMNLDYTKANSDLNQARSVVQPLAADAQIQFCLAQVDPNGSPTSGIERLQTSKTCWDPNTEADKMKSTATGGLNPWDRRYYLNVWIVALCGNTQFQGIGGYAYIATPNALPSSAIDGLVIDYYWGMMSGHTWSHEIGHYLGLHHTWGDLNSNACGNVFPDTDDGFSDTPDSKEANFDCTPGASCSGNSSYGDLLEDFMDYSSCPVLFTTQQCNYMNSVLSGSRASLTTTNNCSTSGAPVANFTGSPTSICVGQSVSFSNSSTGTGNTYSWTFAGGTPSSSTATNPTVTYATAGTYTVTLVATNSNGNNTKTLTNYITVSASNSLPLSEGFESATFPPAGWSLNNPDASNTWERTTSASGFGASAASAYVNNYNYNASGQKDWLITPSYNFTGVSNGRIKWDYAYAQYTNGSSTTGYEDSLEVLYSTNCGTSWVSLWKKGGAQLATTTPTSNNFSPSSSQWKKDSVSLASLNGQSSVRFAFKNACKYGNNIFVDNVNVYNGSAQSGAAPVANFIGTPTTVVVGNSVAFTDLSTNTPTSWNWSFTGGTPASSTAQNPSITYNTVGTYPVTLTAANGSGNDSETKTGYITVIQGGGSQNCDTLSNILAADTLTLYSFSGTASGFVSGHNSYMDKAKAEYYVNPLPGTQVTGGLFYFGHAETLNPNTASITAKVWDATGTNGVTGAPGNVLASQSVLISTIVTDVTNQDLTYVSFPVPATVTGNFFIGFEMTYANGDSVAVVTTTFNSPSGGKGWEQWSDNSWWPYDSSFANGTSNVILPILCSASSGNAPVASFTGSPTSVCPGATVNFTSTSTGNPTSYSWTFTGGTPSASSAQNPSVVYNTSGTYAVSLTVSNANGNNTSTQSGYITVYQKPSLTTSATPVLCFGGSTGSANVTAIGGTPNYTFNWSNNAGTTFSITNKPAGNYTVTVTDAHSCSATAAVNITQPLAALTATGSSTDAACGQANGSATVTATGGAGGYTYHWNTNATTQTVSNLNPGSYQVTVSDANNCTASAAVTVSNATSNFAVTITSQNATCGQANGAATALPNNPTNVTYHWSNNATTGAITGLAPGTYSVTATNPTGCTASASVTITNTGASMSVSFNITQAACGQSNGAAAATVTGGASPYNYLWSTGSTTNSISNVAAGGYPLTVTDNSGCTLVSTAAISNTGAPTVTATPTSPACYGGNNGSAAATATGGTSPYTYNWNTGGTGSTITGITAGTYTVTVHDNAQCIAVQTVTVLNPAAISITISTTNALCGNQNGTAVVTATGGGGTFTYFWNNGSTIANNIDLASGNYTVTVTDNHACTASASATVSATPAPTAVLSPVNGTCQVTPQVNVTVNGGTAPFTYAWSNGAATQNLSGVAAGSYTVTITDANGCTISSSAAVSDNSTLNVTFSSQNPTPGSSNGSITANPSGGTAPYSYVWSTGSTSSTVSSLAAGTYTVTITDQTGCVRVATVILTGPNQVAEVIDEVLIKVYPNPSQEFCNIEIELNQVQDVEMRMYNNVGEQVWEKELNAFKQGSRMVDMSRLASGVYFIRVKLSTGVQTIRLVKE